MHAPHVERVVPMHVFLKLHTAEAEGRGNQPDERGGPGPDVTRGRRHGGQAADGAHAGPDQLGAPEVMPLEEGPDHHGHGRREGGVDQREGVARAGRHGRPAVEAEPAHPQHAGPQRHQRAVVRYLCELAVPVGLELARPHDEDGGERRKARRDVHHDAPGKVHHPPLREEALGVPDPVDEGAVDDGHPQYNKQQVCRKEDAVGERPGDERGGYYCEHHLVAREQQLRYSAPWPRCTRAEICKNRVCRRNTDKTGSTPSISKRERKSDDCPHD
mmetsp:Transcript_85961/g.229374  ORF Transcript_85961/g.229374 Transcript_85961/m.229374 type:complete len:273 (+) Transcript_85961:1040-1858(+)